MNLQNPYLHIYQCRGRIIGDTSYIIFTTFKCDAPILISILLFALPYDGYVSLNGPPLLTIGHKVSDRKRFYKMYKPTRQPFWQFKSLQS